MEVTQLNIEEEIITECCFLNSFGDISIKWKKKNKNFIDEIQKLMDKGYTFFVLKNDKPKKVKDISQIKDREVIIKKEKDLKDILSIGIPLSIEYINGPTNMEVEKVAEKPEDLVGKKSVVSKPMVGG